MRKILTVMLAIALAATTAMGQKRDNDHDADDRAKPAPGKPAPAKAEGARITKGPILEWIGSDEAIIAWSTNVRSSSIIRYGTADEHLSQTAEVPYGGPTHRVTLHNLKPETKYYFVVDSGQGKGSGTEAKSNEQSFTTVKKGEKGKKYSAAGPGM